MSERHRPNWDDSYTQPEYWGSRTPLYIGMPKVFHFYQDLNDNKIRGFLSKLGGRILDAGCGDGRFMDYADVGVDFSKGMLERARRRHPNKNFILASILKLPFKSNVFDAAFSVDVFCHIHPNQRDEATEEVNRITAQFYNILGENRNTAGSILQYFRNIKSKTLWLIIPYVAVFLAFPIDRFKKLVLGTH